MQTLINGVQEFKRTVFPAQRELYEQLAAGQSPEALMITCADSRIDPNLLTQTLPGELFVVRNAGNIIPPHGSGSLSEAAAIEFAVETLGIPHIVVCGHSRCGAMEALVRGAEFIESPALREWVGFASDALAGLPRRMGTQSEVITRVAQNNVLLQLDNLRTHRCVANAVNRGRLHLHGWFYRFETGNILRYDHRQRSFVPLVA